MVLVQETPISPRFYTTNLKKLSSIDTVSSRETFDTVIAELENDYSKDNFIRDETFNQSWDHIQDETRELIIELLKMYCAAEYSGFVLYKELSYQLKEENSILSDGFSLMSRDEARHASFLNKALLDFYFKPSLEFLQKKGRRYNFLPFSWFIYSTYLSEKISSCYYITIFEHLKVHPEFSIYPLFEFYKAWGEDENRHGDFFGAIIKTQTQLSDGFKARLTCKIFLLLIFSMTYFRHRKNDRIFTLFELDAHKYSVNTIKTVNSSIGEDLPIILELENSSFFDKLDTCIRCMSENKRINLSNRSVFFNFLKKTPHYFFPHIKFTWPVFCQIS